jgi:hypothetical protein
LTYFPPRKGADGKYHVAINMGNKAMPSVAVKDIGNVAAEAFATGPAVYGRNVYAVGGMIITTCLTKIPYRVVNYVQIS